MSHNDQLWQRIHGNFSHQAHCEYQVEFFGDIKGGLEGKIDNIVEHMKKLILGYTETVYAGIDFSQVDWTKLALRYWEAYRPLITADRRTEDAQQAEIQANNQIHPSRGTLSSAAQDVLNRSTITGCLLKLPPGQLDTKLYGAIKKALEFAGGKWNTSQQGFLFGFDPTEKLGIIRATGVSINEQKRDQAFYTPSTLACEVVEMAGIEHGHWVLEPSAGRGAMLHHDFARLALADPGFQAIARPVTRAWLQKEGMGPAFIGYVASTWKHFVTDEETAA